MRHCVTHDRNQRASGIFSIPPILSFQLSEQDQKEIEQEFDLAFPKEGKKVCDTSKY